MSQAQLIADCLISAAAIGGLLILAGVLRRDRARDGMTQRFLFGLVVLVVFLTGRLLWWSTGSAVFLPILLVAAGLVPLCVFVMAEGLLRRHGPPLLKYVMLIGTAGFTIASFLPPGLVEPARAYLLLGFQLLGFVGAGWMVVTRDRGTLSPRENWLADRMALSLLLVLPLTATDFRFEWFQSPVGLAGIAILFTCWLVIGLRRSQLGHRDTLRSFAVIAVASAAAGLGIAWIAGLDAVATIQAAAVVLAACLVAAIAVDSANLRAGERRDSIIGHIARGEETDVSSFLRGLRQHIAFDGALLLQADDLVEFDTEALAAIFADDPVRNKAEIATAPRHLDQLAALFERYDVTHILLVGTAPLMLVAVNIPAMSATPEAEMELRAIQRVALLLSERTHA